LASEAAASVMKITILCEYFHPDNSGGTPTDMAELAQYLRTRFSDTDIEVITSRNLYRPTADFQGLAAEEVWHGMRIIRLRTPRSNRASMSLRLMAGACFSAAALIRLLRRAPCDVLLIVTNPPSNGLTAWLFSRFRRVPYVYFVNDLYPDIAVALGCLRARSFFTRFFARLQGSWLRGAARVVVVGRCMQERIERIYGVPRGRLCVIRNWGSPVRVPSGSTQVEFRVAQRLGGFIILYGGNFSHYVDFDRILDAAEKLSHDREVLFVLIGDGVRRREILDNVKNRSLQNVRVLPAVSRSAMTEVLSAANLCLVPLDERMLGLGSPGKLYSILAAGRPVLAMVPPTSEVARILEEENCGINVLRGDANALADAITRLKDSPEIAQRMGMRARDALERRFTLANAASQFHSVLRAVFSESENFRCAEGSRGDKGG